MSHDIHGNDRSWLPVESDGFHADYCEQYEVKNPPEDADCQCPEWMVEQREEGHDV